MNAPSLSMKPLTDLQRSCAAFVNDEHSLQVITDVLNDHGWTTERIVHGGMNQAVKQLAVEASPELLIIDLGDAREARADINALAEVVEPGTMVLAIGDVNDVSLYRDLLASGLHDYLLKPITQEGLREAILGIEMTLSTPVAEVDDPSTHKLCAVIGARGGVGASTLASSLAWIAAHQLNKRAALFDLDIYFGTDALAFDLEPGRGLIDAIENPGRIDSLFIERALIKESENLAILGAEAPITEAMAPDPTALSHLQGELKTNYDVVVVDLPRQMLPNYGYLLQQMNEILLVVDLSLCAARDTIRILSFLKEFAPEAKVRIIANKVTSGDGGEVSKADFESSVEAKIDFVLPADPKTVVMAAKKGKAVPQIAGGSKLSTQIRTLASTIIGEDDGANKGSFWGKLSGLLGSKSDKEVKTK